MNGRRSRVLGKMVEIRIDVNIEFPRRTEKMFIWNYIFLLVLCICVVEDVFGVMS
jgi:hypothetical protein